MISTRSRVILGLCPRRKLLAAELLATANRARQFEAIGASQVGSQVGAAASSVLPDSSISQVFARRGPPRIKVLARYVE